MYVEWSTLCVSVRLHLMPEGKHNLHLRYAAEFNNLVEDFLQDWVIDWTCCYLQIKLTVQLGLTRANLSCDLFTILCIFWFISAVFFFFFWCYSKINCPGFCFFSNTMTSLNYTTNYINRVYQQNCNKIEVTTQTKQRHKRWRIVLGETNYSFLLNRRHSSCIPTTEKPCLYL